MTYNAWKKIDDGSEGAWAPDVWLGVIEAVSRHEGERVYDKDAAIYHALETEFPQLKWRGEDENGGFRPYFRDFSKPWVQTNVVSFNETFSLTTIGRDVVTGKLSAHDCLANFCKSYEEGGEKPFAILADAFLQANRSLSIEEIYFGIMLGFRHGDTISNSLHLASEHTNAEMSSTTKRRLNLLLAILERVGAIIKTKSNSADRWRAWDSELLSRLSDTPVKVTVPSVSIEGITTAFFDEANAAKLALHKRMPERFIASLLAKRFLILTGLSGSGKTKLAHAFAAWLTPAIDHGDPFIPGAKIKSERVTYIVRNSDRISVEFSNNEDDSRETLVVLPRALIEEWASYISSNHLERETPARQIREGVSATSNYSAQLHSFETHLKAAAFALLGAEESNQQHPFYRVVAVGADWSTNENIVGYQDALQDKIYRKPSNGALDVILRAELDPARPYFLILDEMNLSHVERYFADILSAIESRQEIALHSSPESLKSSVNDTLLVPSKINLPKNLFIIGTVNVDETTYMFSPKVLDRANVIEFRATADDISAFLDAPTAVDMELLAGKGAGFGAAFVAEAAVEVSLKDETADALKARLVEVFAALAPIGAEFGFRTAYEITRFIHFHEKLTGEGWQFKDALDAQVLQKLMPKLHGSQRRLEPVLKALEGFCTEHQCNASLEKIKRMQDRLKDGFTSFAEA